MISSEVALKVTWDSFNQMRIRVIHACMAEWDEHEMCLPKHISEEFDDTWIELASWN